VDVIGDVDLVLDAGADLGEGPTWDAAAHLLIWVDITQGVVHLFDPQTARTESIEVGQPLGAAVPTIRSPGDREPLTRSAR
jgi:sugar lactone lactonase YvrE